MNKNAASKFQNVKLKNIRSCSGNEDIKQDLLGVQTAISHFPAVLECSGSKEVLFTLQFWESAIATTKNSHSTVFEGCPDSFDGVMVLFSCSDWKSFELLPKSINNYENHTVEQSPCFFVVSIGCSSEEQSVVMHKDVIQFEKQWNIPILVVPFISSELECLSVAGFREILLSTICESLWLRDKNSLLKNTGS